jgi:hypothetical protein
MIPVPGRSCLPADRCSEVETHVDIEPGLPLIGVRPIETDTIAAALIYVRLQYGDMPMLRSQ